MLETVPGAVPVIGARLFLVYTSICLVLFQNMFVTRPYSCSSNWFVVMHQVKLRNGLQHHRPAAQWTLVRHSKLRQFAGGFFRPLFFCEHSSLAFLASRDRQVLRKSYSQPKRLPRGAKRSFWRLATFLDHNRSTTASHDLGIIRTVCRVQNIPFEHNTSPSPRQPAPA